MTSGRQRDARRRIATFRQATLRVAPHRYATLEPLGKPGGLRARLARTVPLKRLWLRTNSQNARLNLPPNSMVVDAAGELRITFARLIAIIKLFNSGIAQPSVV